MKKYITYVDGFQNVYIEACPQKTKKQLKTVAYIEVSRKTLMRSSFQQP